MQYRRLAVALAVVVLLAAILPVTADFTRNADHQGIRCTHAAQTVAAVKVDSTVYITKSGAKFHAAGCRYLKKSKTAIRRSQAIKRGYTACKVCKP